jgi:hypothetical protein
VLCHSQKFGLAILGKSAILWGTQGGVPCERSILGSSIYPAEAPRYFRVFSLWFVGYFVASEWETN